MLILLLSLPIRSIATLSSNALYAVGAGSQARRIVSKQAVTTCARHAPTCARLAATCAASTRRSIASSARRHAATAPKNAARWPARTRTPARQLRSRGALARPIASGLSQPCEQGAKIGAVGPVPAAHAPAPALHAPQCQGQAPRSHGVPARAFVPAALPAGTGAAMWCSVWVG